MTFSTLEPFGRYPSRVFRGWTFPTGELYVKDDGGLRADYGGNKIRKLELLLPELAARGVKRLLTVGPAGSHHVLATTLLAKELGMATAAAIFPQPYSLHAQETLSCALALGLEPLVVSSRADVPRALLRARRPGDAFLAPGASSPEGARGYALAVGELAAQVRAGELPEPDLIVVAAGSGGTAAGLLAGLLQTELRARLVAVDIGAAGPWIGALVAGLAWEVLRRGGRTRGIRQLTGRLTVHRDHRGLGYGHALPGFAELSQRARGLSLSLDPAYTGKALATAFELAEGRARAKLRAPIRVLYWHTLSRGLPHPKPPALPNDLQPLFVERSRGL